MSEGQSNSATVTGAQFVQWDRQLSFAIKSNLISAAVLFVLAVALAWPHVNVLLWGVVFCLGYVIFATAIRWGQINSIYKGEQLGYFLLPLPEVAEVVELRDLIGKMFLRGLVIFLLFAGLLLLVGFGDGSDLSSTVAFFFVLPLLFGLLYIPYLWVLRKESKDKQQVFYIPLAGTNVFSRKNRELRRFIYFKDA